MLATVQAEIQLRRTHRYIDISKGRLLYPFVALQPFSTRLFLIEQRQVVGLQHISCEQRCSTTDDFVVLEPEVYWYSDAYIKQIAPDERCKFAAVQSGFVEIDPSYPGWNCCFGEPLPFSITPRYCYIRPKSKHNSIVVLN